MISCIATAVGPVIQHLATLERDELEMEFGSFVSSVTDNKSQLRLAPSETAVLVDKFISLVPGMEQLRELLPKDAFAASVDELFVVRGSVVNPDNGQRVSVVITVNLFFAVALRIALRRHNAWDGFRVQLCIRAPPGHSPASPSATLASSPGSRPTTPSAAERRK